LSGKGRPGPPVPTGISDFAFFFDPILAPLAQHWWMFDDCPTSTPRDATVDDIDIYEDYVCEELSPWAGKRFAPPGVLLPRFGRFIRDDWITLFGTPSQPNPDRFLSALETVGDEDRLVEEHVAILFRNVDGAYWEMYAKQTELLAAVALHIRTVDLPLLEDLDLSESRRLM